MRSRSRIEVTLASHGLVEAKKCPLWTARGHANQNRSTADNLSLQVPPFWPSHAGRKHFRFQIDFAHTYYMDGLSWETWQDSKACFDEEGVVGFVMQKQLEGGFKYKLFYKYYLDCGANDK